MSVAVEVPNGGPTRLRRMSMSLPKLQMPDPDPFNMPPGGCCSKEEVVEEGKELFGHFMIERIEEEGLTTPDECLVSAGISTCNSPQNECHNPIWARTGSELRMMADEFAKTKEREKVKQKANEVGVSDVTYEQFRGLMVELFTEGGVTKERIMVLFLFCSDVAVVSLRKGKELFQKFVNWSVQFITEKVCSWVQDHGGWSAVFNTSIVFLSNVMKVFGCGLVLYIVYKKVRQIS